MNQLGGGEVQRMTWLVIEDDHAIRDVIGTMCELWGFDAVMLKDGFQASEYLQNEAPTPQPDIALIDIRMPGPWGHEIGAKIRAHPRLHNIGIILMTAYTLPEGDAEQYMNLSGADMLLYKPLPPMDELLKLVQQIVERRRALAGQ